MAEIGADQLPLDRRDGDVLQPQRLLDLGIALNEDAARLPVPRLEVAQHQVQLGFGFRLFEREDGVDDPPDAAGLAGMGPRFDGDVERADDDTRCVRLQPERTVSQIN